MPYAVIGRYAVKRKYVIPNANPMIWARYGEVSHIEYTHTVSF